MSNRLFVGNLPYLANEAGLKKLFAKAGLVAKTTIIKDRRGHSRGYGFVEMSNQTEARTAISQLNSYPFSVGAARRNLYVAPAL